MKRTEIPHSAFKRSAGPVSSKVPAAEPKKRSRRCALPDCRERFEPRSMAHRACCPDHAQQVVALEKARKDRKERQEGLQKLKRRADYLQEAQANFNAFIRLRDRLACHSCISSGRPLDWSGNAVDAGHYRSTGSAPHLRFNEDNCHAQSKHDNLWLAGNAVDYRIQLIRRIGLDRVEALESDDTARKFSVDDLIAIKAHYGTLVRSLKAKVAAL